MSIPLVQDNNKDSINTSIIAIKRYIERINMLLGLSNSEEIDTSVFATKDELQQAITGLSPVDEVTLNNMQSVTSNAVAEALGLKPVTSQFAIKDLDRFNLTLPSSYQYLIVVTCTPFFAFSDFIPKVYLDDNLAFTGFHADPSVQNIVEYRIVKTGSVTISRVRENNTASTGRMYIFYR